MPTEIELLNRLINIKDYVIDLTTTEFDEENKTVRFFMVPQRTAICNHCGSLCDQVKDRKLRAYTDLFFGIWRAEIWIYKRRVKWRAELRWQRLLPLEKFYSMVEKHLDGILNYCDIKLPLGLVESLNEKIKTLLRRSRGFINEQQHFALRIMFMTDSQRYNFLSGFHT